MIAATIVVLTSACSAPPKVAVEERKVLTVRQETESLGGQLVRHAQPGDTLYAMAFIAGVDVKTLAAWNNMHEGDTLFVGQKIRLTKPIGFTPPVAKRKKPTRARSVSKANPRPAGQVSTEPLSGVAKNESNSVDSTSARSVKPSVNKKPQQAAAAKRFAWVKQWRWPLSGKVLRGYNPTAGQQGIDIAAGLGAQVNAAAAGQVVYSGSSLKGYGHLIIVKHNDEYLSAYAHTQAVRVQEGDWVNQDQALAKVGLNNQGRAALHFQIRRNGSPTNPLNLLPKRPT